MINAARCTGHRSALHQPSQRAASFYLKRCEMMRKTVLTLVAAALMHCTAPVADAAETRLQDNGQALVNPGMGWTMHFYSNLLCNYGSKLASLKSFMCCSVGIASLIPVTLRCPCSTVETSPAPTGSVTVPKTTGVVFIAVASATATGVAIPTATSTFSALN